MKDNRFVNYLAGELSNVCDKPHWVSEKKYEYLMQLSEYFIRKIDREAHLKLHPINIVHPAGDSEIMYSDYLVDIVKALSSVVKDEYELLCYGKNLVDMTGQVYSQRADSYEFAKRLIPALVQYSLVKTGEELEKGAKIAKDRRMRNEVFFPYLVKGIEDKKILSLDDLGKYH